MGEEKKITPFDLEDRTYEFAKRCREFTKNVPKVQTNFEYNKQLIRSSGSTAANYIEANEAISSKDFLHRIKICRKEAKESRLWLKLIEINGIEKLLSEQVDLIRETTEFIKIFTSIIIKKQQRKEV
jgi:four helix bundle protein